MTMQHKRGAFFQFKGQSIEIREFAFEKMARTAEREAIRINEIDMASRRVLADNPDLATWFCLHLHHNREASVENALTKDEINSLVLREPEEVVVRRGRKWTLPGKVWLPGFILVQCVPSPAAFRGLLGVEHVTGIVGGWERPYKVPEASINKFNEVMSEREDVREQKRKEQEERNASIGKGDKVRITLGPFVNLEALVLQMLKGGEKRCKVQCNLFGGKSEVTMPLANLEKL